ncbi:MAG TPA: RNA 2',3'-cyclic phosphodiesterase, partial [Candidatus Deferrimicrobiaceae bacterium]
SGIASAIAALRLPRDPVSWTPAGNLHVTLKFLGETAPDRLPAIRDALESTVSPFATFELDAEGGGAFPSARAPRVLWVGFREPLELARTLQDNIEAALEASGFPRDGRPFHPHVTIGRVRGATAPGWGDATVGALAGRRFGTVPVASVLLFESRLSPSGATYRVIGRFPLSGGAASQGL